MSNIFDDIWNLPGDVLDGVGSIFSGGDNSGYSYDGDGSFVGPPAPDGLGNASQPANEAEDDFFGNVGEFLTDVGEGLHNGIKYYQQTMGLLNGEETGTSPATATQSQSASSFAGNSIVGMLILAVIIFLLFKK